VFKNKLFGEGRTGVLALGLGNCEKQKLDVNVKVRKLVFRNMF